MLGPVPFDSDDDEDSGQDDIMPHRTPRRFGLGYSDLKIVDKTKPITERIVRKLNKHIMLALGPLDAFFRMVSSTVGDPLETMYSKKTLKESVEALLPKFGQVAKTTFESPQLAGKEAAIKDRLNQLRDEMDELAERIEQKDAYDLQVRAWLKKMSEREKKLQESLNVVTEQLDNALAGNVKQDPDTDTAASITDVLDHYGTRFGGPFVASAVREELVNIRGDALMRVGDIPYPRRPTLEQIINILDKKNEGDERNKAFISLQLSDLALRELSGANIYGLMIQVRVFVRRAVNMPDLSLAALFVDEEVAVECARVAAALAREVSGASAYRGPVNNAGPSFYISLGKAAQAQRSLELRASQQWFKRNAYRLISEA